MKVKCMRRLSAIKGCLIVLGLAVVVGAASASATVPGSGSLVGQTQISFGCPGPVRVGQPSCHPWHPFPHARFAIRQTGPTGQLPQIIRLITSDANAHFIIRLNTGRYTITPLPQQHTHGGRSLTVQIKPGRVTNILVRYQGYPRMV